MARRVAVLTGGGDVPGLNVVIKTLTFRLEDEGWEVLGLRRGWAALLQLGPGSPVPEADWVVRLTRQNTRTIDRTGGTILHTSRTNPMAVRPDELPAHLEGEAPEPGAKGKVDMTRWALRAIEDLRLDALIAIGGDDTLSFARRLHQEGAAVIGIPKTMDNDVYGTDYCIGFSTAVSRSVNMIGDLRSPSGSHERYLVVELFGRNSGETSLMVALLAAVDRALISEVPFEPERVLAHLAHDRRTNPSHYSVLTISEGASIAGQEPVEWGEPDAFGHKKLGGIGLLLGDYIRHKTREHVIYQNLGYLMRSGPPDSLDRMVAINFARTAAELVLQHNTGKLVSIQGGCYALQPITVVGEGHRRVDVERYYDAKEYRPKLDSVIGLPMFLQ